MSLKGARELKEFCERPEAQRKLLAPYNGTTYWISYRSRDMVRIHLPKGSLGPRSGRIRLGGYVLRRFVYYDMEEVLF
jgi:hypothetical protein